MHRNDNNINIKPSYNTIRHDTFAEWIMRVLAIIFVVVVPLMLFLLS